MTMMATALAACLTCLFVAVGAGATPPINEALARPASSDELSYVGSPEHLRTIMANMTLDKAVHQLEHVPEALHPFLHHFQGESAKSSAQKNGAPKADVFLQSRTKRVTISSMKSAQKTKDANAAKAQLNDMLLKAEGKADFEKIRCSDLCDQQQHIIEDARQNVNEYNARGAEARARILTAQSTISESEEALPKLGDNIHAHDAKCKSDKAAAEATLALLQKDFETLDKITEMSECTNDWVSLFQCSHHKGAPRIQFRHHGARNHVAQLRTQTVRNILQRTLSDITKTPNGQPARQLHRHSIRRHHVKPQQRRVAHRRGTSMRQRRSAHHRRLSLLSQRHAKRRYPQGGYYPPYEPIGEDGMVVEDHSQGCSISDAVECDEIRSKFLTMHEEVADKVDVTKADMANADMMCEATKSSYESQMNNIRQRLSHAQSVLAEATKVEVETQSQSRLEDQRVTALVQEDAQTKGECSSTLKSIAGEICGVKKIRQELYKMQSERPFIQDCEVSDWTPDACSVSCGGGTQILRRMVINPSDGGAACPVLEMQKSCNQHLCPVDCRLDEWGGWSSCSAHCNGGVMERIRHVKKEPRYGGAPCTPTTQSVSCNNEACDQDCGLGPWTEWSSCSKACDGGFLTRNRHVISPPRGSGSCPTQYADSRLQYKRCNEHACVPDENDGKLRCEAELDVVVLLDGSSSLGQQGFDYAKTAASNLMGYFDLGEGKTQVAVLLFSGPSTAVNMNKCFSDRGNIGEMMIGAPTTTQAPPDVATDCNMRWIRHFTTDAEATLAGDIAALEWPRATQATSMALKLAETELLTGRMTAQKVVIVITDGKPMSSWLTSFAARSLKEQARLIWVPITEDADIDNIKEWASQPVADNVLMVRTPSELASKETLNKLVADACPKIGNIGE